MMKTVNLPIHFIDLAEIMNNRAVCDVIMLGHTSSTQFPHEMIPLHEHIVVHYLRQVNEVNWQR